MNGGWGSWTSWSSCSATCGDSQKIRQRFCDNPPPSWGGSNCSGNSTQQQTCDTKDCPSKIKVLAIYASKILLSYACLLQLTDNGEVLAVGLPVHKHVVVVYALDNNHVIAPHPPMVVGKATRWRHCNTNTCPPNGQKTTHLIASVYINSFRMELMD